MDSFCKPKQFHEKLNLLFLILTVIFFLFLWCWLQLNLIVFVGGYETKFIGDLTEVDEVEIRRIESTWYDVSFSKCMPYFYLPM